MRKRRRRHHSVVDFDLSDVRVLKRRLGQALRQCIAIERALLRARKLERPATPTQPQVEHEPRRLMIGPGDCDTYGCGYGWHVRHCVNHPENVDVC